MTIYRGPGGGGNADSDAEINQLAAFALEAENSAIAAAASAAEAAGSEADAIAAAASAAAALSSQNAAAASAAAALSSKDSAETAKTAAELAETNAETAQTAAQLAETNAETAETNAELAETNAEASAVAAASSASTATTQAGLASTSASNAAISASNAATSASGASTSASNAASSASSAADSYDSFDDRYLGAKSSNPTLDNDGNALLTGALYWNTVSNEMRVYSGSAWIVSYLPADGYVQKTGDTMSGSLSVTGTVAATTFSGAGTSLTGTASALSIGGNAETATTATNQSGGTVSATSITDSGNLAFTGTGNRITGDFSNATIANRVAFQTSTANGNTDVQINPNGTATITGLRLNNNSDPTNAGIGRISISSANFDITSGINGTGIYLPMTFYTGGSERVRIDTSGNVGIGTTTPSSYGKLAVNDTGAKSVYVRSSSTNFSGLLLENTNSATKWQIGVEGGLYNTAGLLNIGIDAVGPKMVIDSSGNVGIGTSSPGYPLQVVGSLGYVATNQFTDDSLGGGFITAKSRGTTTSPTTVLNNDSLGLFSAGGYNSASIAYNKAALQMYAAENWTTTANGSYLTLATTATGATGRSERMRIDSSGNLLVGTTAVSNSCKQTLQFTTGTNGLCILTPDNISGTDFAIFKANGAVCGAISRVGTTAAVVYTATSDYRLKTVVGVVSGQGARIDALEPIEYTWNSSGLRTRGFLAHKFQEVYADSVTGTKDAVDADGKPAYQGMQASSSEVIADLVAEIQDLRKRLAAAGI